MDTTETKNSSGNGAPLARVQPATAAMTTDPRAACAPSSLAQVQRLADVVAASGLYGVKSPEEAMIRMMTGMELGLSAMQSIRGVYVIETQGVRRPSLAADMMVGVVKMHGDVCAYFRMIESTDSIATYETQRRGEPTPVKLSYTIQQANVAGLTGKGTWKAHPAAMLRARCSSALARIVYPDLVNGLYDPDEIEDAPRASVSAVSAVVEAKAQTAARPSDASALGDIYQRLEAAADEGAFKALAAEAVAAARAGKISDADLSAFKDAHKAHKAQWLAQTAPPAPVDDLPEPGSDG